MMVLVTGVCPNPLQDGHCSTDNFHEVKWYILDCVKDLLDRAFDTQLARCS